MLNCSNIEGFGWERVDKLPRKIGCGASYERFRGREGEAGDVIKVIQWWVDRFCTSWLIHILLKTLTFAFRHYHHTAHFFFARLKHGQHFDSAACFKNLVDGEHSYTTSHPLVLIEFTASVLGKIENDTTVKWSWGNYTPHIWACSLNFVPQLFQSLLLFLWGAIHSSLVGSTSTPPLLCPASLRHRVLARMLNKNEDKKEETSNTNTKVKWTPFWIKLLFRFLSQLAYIGSEGSCFWLHSCSCFIVFKPRS